MSNVSKINTLLKLTGKMLLVTVVMTIGLLFVAMVLRHFAPSLSIPHLLHQYRYSLLAWRLCVYTAIVALWSWLYRRAGSRQRSALKRLIGWFLLLMLLNEFCCLTQYSGGQA
ncbi:MAG: hypothetical protein ACRCWW_06465 [Scandinavium sp.]|uniref:hypothetical protein n=1 Tax=Scandinavium sp. TaxID=2830653 RepID=UPI003F38D45D